MTQRKQVGKSAAAAAEGIDRKPSLAEVQAQLEVIIERLEDEDTGLEQSIELYERGSRLLATAGEVLADAEQRVRILSERDEQAADDDA